MLEWSILNRLYKHLLFLFNTCHEYRHHEPQQLLFYFNDLDLGYGSQGQWKAKLVCFIFSNSSQMVSMKLDLKKMKVNYLMSLQIDSYIINGNNQCCTECTKELERLCRDIYDMISFKFTLIIATTELCFRISVSVTLILERVPLGWESASVEHCILQSFQLMWIKCEMLVWNTGTAALYCMVNILWKIAHSGHFVN